MSQSVPQATDFLEECASLHDVLQTLPEGDFARTTQFKGWTLDEILRHLHVWNDAAAIAGLDRQAFMDFRAALETQMTHAGLHTFEEARLGPAMHGQRFLAAWWEGCGRVATAHRDADPRARVPWVGPDMSAASAITARQMETWAHGQAIFDLLGLPRIDGDRLGNVAYLGVDRSRFAAIWHYTGR